MFTLSGFREDLLGVTIFPEVLNNRPDAELVAHTHKYYCASLQKYVGIGCYMFSTRVESPLLSPT